MATEASVFRRRPFFDLERCQCCRGYGLRRATSPDPRIRVTFLVECIACAGVGYVKARRAR